MYAICGGLSYSRLSNVNAPLYAYQNHNISPKTSPVHIIVYILSVKAIYTIYRLISQDHNNISPKTSPVHIIVYILSVKAIYTIYRLISQVKSNQSN